MWSTAYTVPWSGMICAMAAVMNPDPVPMSSTVWAVVSLLCKYCKVSACMLGADIVVPHPIYFGTSLYGFSSDPEPPAAYIIIELIESDSSLSAFRKYFRSTLLKTSSTCSFWMPLFLKSAIIFFRFGSIGRFVSSNKKYFDKCLGIRNIWSKNSFDFYGPNKSWTSFSFSSSIKYLLACMTNFFWFWIFYALSSSSCVTFKFWTISSHSEINCSLFSYNVLNATL